MDLTKKTPIEQIYYLILIKIDYTYKDYHLENKNLIF